MISFLGGSLFTCVTMYDGSIGIPCNVQLALGMLKDGPSAFGT